MRKISFTQERIKIAKSVKASLIKLSLILAIAAISGMFFSTVTVFADRFQDQINKLRQENNQNIQQQQALQAQEQDINAAIASLQANIATIEAQIRENQQKHAEMAQKIAVLEVEIAKQRNLLGISVRQLYLDDQMSTIEKLASSKSLGDYVDKEHYNVSVQNKIKNVMEKIEKLKDEQEKQKIAVEKLLDDQQVMQGQLSEQKAEQERLRRLNLQQQQEYASNVRTNNTRIMDLQRQQAAENARHRMASGSSTPRPVTTNRGSYPYANHPFPNRIVDPWGMYTRQCVSYTAWKVASTGRHMPYWGGHGNANQWPGNARAAGIPVNSTPRVGSIAASMAGFYGHVMYVEAVYGDGTIYVSDYNSDWTGRYAEYRRSAAGLQFIHF